MYFVPVLFWFTHQFYQVVLIKPLAQGRFYFPASCMPSCALEQCLFCIIFLWVIHVDIALFLFCILFRYSIKQPWPVSVCVMKYPGCQCVCLLRHLGCIWPLFLPLLVWLFVLLVISFVKFLNLFAFFCCDLSFPCTFMIERDTKAVYLTGHW